MENYENVGLFEKDSLISTYADEIAGISHFMNFFVLKFAFKSVHWSVSELNRFGCYHFNVINVDSKSGNVKTLVNAI